VKAAGLTMKALVLESRNAPFRLADVVEPSVRRSTIFGSATNWI